MSNLTLRLDDWRLVFGVGKYADFEAMYFGREIRKIVLDNVTRTALQTNTKVTHFLVHFEKIEKINVRKSAIWRGGKSTSFTLW
jgi:hypothetical protein